MLIAVLNKSTLVKDFDVELMCKAVQKQMLLHVAPAWNQKTPKIKFYTDKNKIPGYSWVVTILDDSVQAGVLGYHSENNNQVDAFVFAKPVLSNGGVVLFDNNNPENFTVSTVFSHEVIEMFGDRFANMWADGPSLAQGKEYAFELCDPVESDFYNVDITVDNQSYTVAVSNFVFPSWFNIQATVDFNMPFDYLKKLNKPFSMSPGGYLIVRNTGRVSQVFGHHMPHWKIHHKKHHKGRR